MVILGYICSIIINSVFCYVMLRLIIDIIKEWGGV
jgi:hypothetical protein